MPHAAFEITGLTKGFGATKALDAAGLTIGEGMIHGLVGGNGAGKSTLLKILTGIHRQDSGTVRLRGEVYEPKSPLDAMRHGVAMIPQELRTVPGLSVTDNVVLGQWPAMTLRPVFARTRGLALPMVDRKAATAIAKRHLESLGLDLDPGRLLSELTFAERQSVVIARAIACDARILIFDEPTAALAQHEALMLFALIRSLQARGVTIIYVSHRLAEIEDLCDRVTALQDGRVVTSFTRGHFNAGDLAAAITGQRAAAPQKRSFAPAPQTPLLTAQNASPRGGWTLSLGAGQIIGLHGLLGSGIGAFLKSLSGARGPREIALGEKRVTLKSPRQAIDCGIGYVPSERASAIVPALSVRDNILLPHLGRFSRGGRLDTKAMDRAAAPLMAALDIRPRDPSIPAGSLSGGNQQKVLFARWMLGTTSLLLLDEPTHGIDVGAKALIKQKIGDFARAHGAVLMHSVEMDDLVELAGEIQTMVAGHLSALPRETSATHASPAP